MRLLIDLRCRGGTEAGRAPLADRLAPLVAQLRAPAAHEVHVLMDVDDDAQALAVRAELEPVLAPRQVHRLALPFASPEHARQAAEAQTAAWRARAAGRVRAAAVEAIAPDLVRAVDLYGAAIDAAVLAQRPSDLPAAEMPAAEMPAAEMPAARPRLALVTPVPPAATGVADYTAALLPALARYYAIDVVCPQPATTDARVAAHAALRSLEWFEAHRRDFDRIVYQVGNSLHHAHMPELLARHPGVVVLHDLALSDLLEHLERVEGQAHRWRRALYRSHGWPALRDAAIRGDAAAVRTWPASKAIFDDADGVILNSAFAARWARALYGPDLPVRVGGLARAVEPCAEPCADRSGESSPARAETPVFERSQARRRLGLPDDAFVVCTFGIGDPSKLWHRLLEAWPRTALAAQARARLAFVGDLPGGAYGERLGGAIATAPRADGIRCTGRVDAQGYRDWLVAADLAVQLRADTRGESSGALLDALAHGLPTVVNALGPAAELPAEAAVRLAERFEDHALAAAIDRLAGDASLRARLSQGARAYLGRAHDPQAVAAAFAQAIEHFHAHGRPARWRRLAEAVAAPDRAPDDASDRASDGASDGASGRTAIDPTTPTARADLVELARAIAANEPARGPAQLLVDVTAIAQHDLGSGIQRVVRSVLGTLLGAGIPGMRVEPVRLCDGAYRYARAYACRALGLPQDLLDDAPVEVRAGDVFLGLDLATDAVHLHEPIYARWRACGVRVHFVVFDLLPVELPQHFPAEDAAHYRGWLGTVCRVADGLACISRATADALRAHQPALAPQRAVQARVDWFRLGADLPAPAPTEAVSAADHALAQRLARRRAFLMVGTVEPRKGHAAAIDAFETLWSRGHDVDLVIVGRAGWMVETLVTRLRRHPERGARLVWLERAGDALLQRLYGACSALLMASEGEGFGLPLVEAAQRGLPIVTRDLPVFREIAGPHAHYWHAGSEPLAAALERWLALHADGAAPGSSGLRWNTWAQATAGLLRAVLGPGARLCDAVDCAAPPPPEFDA